MGKKIQGAEAEIKIMEDKVIKTRPEKRYRHRDLDSRLRKERTEMEQKLTVEAKRYGVNAPETEMTEENVLEIERIEGEPLKEEIEERPKLLKDLGRNIAYLHSADIIHGDLTTSNAIVGGEVAIIDFGLAFRSERAEDKAVDIHLLKQVLESSHPEVAETAWENFVEGYTEYENSDEVMEQLKEVEKRGRYK